ncbi:MAG: phosphoglycolate phosphatase [Pseudomonadota bacterium]
MILNIVFDLDGTLIDSAPDIHAAANKVLAAEGLGQITFAQSRGYVGHGAAVFIERMRADLGLGEERQAPLLAAFLELYEGAVHLTEPYRGVVAALEALTAKGHRLGVCTNKPIGPTRAVLAHLDLARFFPVVLGGDSMAVRKPDPTPLLAAFEGLGEGMCVYVGDSEVDAETASRAEVPFYLYSPGYRKTPVEELYHTAAFDDFAELPGLLDTLGKG